jgi:hypothetical protein
MKPITQSIPLVALLLAVIATGGCVSTRETVYRDVERAKVEFESDGAARLFYEAFTRSPEFRNRNQKTSSFNIPVVFHHHRTEKDSENTSFNEAVRRCDTNRDSRITEQEARIYTELVSGKK